MVRYGSICYSDRDSAVLAQSQLNNTLVARNTIRVDWYHPPVEKRYIQRMNQAEEKIEEEKENEKKKTEEKQLSILSTLGAYDYNFLKLLISSYPSIASFYPAEVSK